MTWMQKYISAIIDSQKLKIRIRSKKWKPISKIDCSSSYINDTICFKTHNIQNDDVYVVEIDLPP